MKNAEQVTDLIINRITKQHCHSLQHQEQCPQTAEENLKRAYARASRLNESTASRTISIIYKMQYFKRIQSVKKITEASKGLFG